MKITTIVEIPEELHEAAQQYLETHKNWSQERMMQAAMSLFLLQNGGSQPRVSQLYCDSLFGGAM
ncbi:MAG: DUF2811 domain-containing protein [Cyanobacteria bacterium J06634_6]